MSAAAADRIPLLPREERERRSRRAGSEFPAIWNLLDAVKDPEIPVVNIWDLGILQDVTMDGETAVVTVTPTYSGCPAMGAIEREILHCLETAGYRCRVESRLSPAWSTSWMSERAREALLHYGIAPPTEPGQAIACPRCGSGNARVISRFGSTACKALYRCEDCREPFDRFKPF